MKFFIYIFLFLNITLKSFGHTHTSMTGRIGNVYYEGLVAGETQYQNQAIAFLCHQFVKTYYPSFKKKVYLELRHLYNLDYQISYDKYEGNMFDYAEKNRTVKGLGIRIRLSQRSTNAETVLKLLEYSILHFSELKTARKKFLALASEYDRTDELTVDSLTLKKVIESPMNEKIKNILNIQVPRNLGRTKSNFYTEYYFQNDVFYFKDFLHKDSVYLEIKQIYQIISDYYLGTLILETDSTGYFYNRETKKLSSKFAIKNKLESFYFTHTSTDNSKKRLYFEYQTYKKKKYKFIYLADKLMLISKIEDYEDEFIQKEIEKNKKE